MSTNQSDTKNIDSTANQPQPVNTDHGSHTAASPEVNKKAKISANNNFLIDQLPTGELYEASYMHRDVVHIVLTTKSDFLITGSVDGNIKFWKKKLKGIEFVKHYKAHYDMITSMKVSKDGLLLASISKDKTIKLFDVVNFDMIHIIQTEYVGLNICWVKNDLGDNQLLCSDSASNNIYQYHLTGNKEINKFAIHQHPTAIIEFNETYKCCLSIDTSGLVEYWDLKKSHGLPKNIGFKYKTETDLYAFKKEKTTPLNITFSNNDKMFACLSEDQNIRIFDFSSGKVIKKYNESVELVGKNQKEGSKYKIEEIELGRRLAVEKELLKSQMYKMSNIEFDYSDKYIMYATLLGIKVVDIKTNKLAKLYAFKEQQRFINISFYHGSIKKKAATTLEMIAADNPLIKTNSTPDPIIFCTAYKKHRFYMFSNRPPFTEQQMSERDIFNEKPTSEGQAFNNADQKINTQSKHAIICTTKGDITLELLPDIAPKAVENFITHSKNGYYDNVIFHRVIRNFMIQTGDPMGDGTGGESIWKKDFEDEFHKNLTHNKPYRLSMANGGANTNGSQFFITTVPAPWLDMKHTVFGFATSGMDVIHAIENIPTDHYDRPLQQVKVYRIVIKE